MTNIKKIIFNPELRYVAIKKIKQNDYCFVEDYVYPSYVSFTSNIKCAKKIDKTTFTNSEFKKMLDKNNIYIAVIDKDFSLTWDISALKLGYLYNDIYKVDAGEVKFNKYTISDFLQFNDGKLVFLDDIYDYDDNKELFCLKKIGY